MSQCIVRLTEQARPKGEQPNQRSNNLVSLFLSSNTHLRLATLRANHTGTTSRTLFIRIEAKREVVLVQMQLRHFAAVGGEDHLLLLRQLIVQPQKNIPLLTASAPACLMPQSVRSSFDSRCCAEKEASVRSCCSMSKSSKARVFLLRKQTRHLCATFQRCRNILGTCGLRLLQDKCWGLGKNSSLHLDSEFHDSRSRTASLLTATSPTAHSRKSR
jgi:hypothetical protein